ncbi:uncharacterized protein LOC124161201 isoform X2 [Ischnura elegans]|nr:uncharacterized protein LOC124161201 isoform X2 [Ischnura elegans]
MNQLSQYEERKVKILLSKIAALLSVNCMLLRPYFQDYEMIAKGKGTITITHFARVLNFLGLKISSEDFQLLIKKFLKDSFTINYVAFISALSDVGECVDKYKASLCDKTVSADIPKVIRPELDQVRNREVFGPRTSFHPATDPINRWKCHGKIGETMARIQRHAFGNRIRTDDFFKVFDQANCGRITVDQFRRGLDGFGISGIHHLYLSEQDINDIINVYRDPNDSTHVCWKVFENDVDLIFTTKNLEKYPGLKIKNPVQGENPPLMTHCTKEISNDTEYNIVCEDVVRRIKQKITAECMNIRPQFRAYDRPNYGHVSIPQFRQCLIYYGILLSMEEILALEDRYSDDMGFNYTWFLKEVEPLPLQDPMYDDLIKAKVLISKREICDSPTKEERDITAVLTKIKNKVVSERIKIIDFFIDYDKLRKFMISKENFIRGLDLCDLNLSNTEVQTLIYVFKNPFQDNYVDYERFCRTIESALAIEGLQRDPMLVPIQYIPPKDYDTNFLNREEREAVNTALTMLTQRSIYDQNLIECFKDYDKYCCGTVSRSDFLRGLALRKLTDHLSSKDLDLLMKCFGDKKGERINYRTFSNCLDMLRCITERKPF